MNNKKQTRTTSIAGKQLRPWQTPKLVRLHVSATKVGSVDTSFEGGMTGSGQVYHNSSPS
ncbi:MAG: hypothetical protein AAF614_30325 [Chloroflexota bacterium]